MQNKLNPYVFGGVSMYDVGYDNGFSQQLEDKHFGADIGIGIRPHQNFGIEASYFRTTEESKETATTYAETQLSGFAVDAIGFYPVADNTELFGSVGLVRTKAEVSGLSSSVSDNETKLRFGLGGQYHIDDNWSARVRITRTNADFGGVADDYMTYNLGVAYRF